MRSLRGAVVVVATLAVAACSDDGAPGDGGVADAGVVAFVARVPLETADDESLARLGDWSALPVRAESAYAQRSSYDRGDGAAAPLPILESGNRDLNNFVCRSAGARPAGSGLVPFHFDEPECGDAEGFVLARFEGSGVLTRIWMTAFGALGAEVLRVYLDGAREPAIEVRLRDAWSGAASDMFAPPFGAGSSSHLAWHYPVVFTSKLVVAIDQLGPLNAYYHQVDAALDRTPRARAAPSSVSPMRDVARRALTEPLDRGTSLASSGRVVVDPGATVRLVDVDGPATVRALELTVPTIAMATLADLGLEVVWDGAPEPAMSLPLDELFAAALAPPEIASPVLSARREGDDTVLSLALPMPFRSHASVTVTSRATTSVTLALSLSGSPGLGGGSYELYATRSESGPGDAERHPIVTATGPGRLVGVCFMLEGHALDRLGSLSAGGLNFLEGDERVTIDGAPAIIGTGTEDYLESAFYFRDGAFGTPFAQAWDVADDRSAAPARGRVSACRWHVGTDVVDFARDLTMDLEIGPAAPELRDRYRTVAFVYR